MLKFTDREMLAIALGALRVFEETEWVVLMIEDHLSDKSDTDFEDDEDEILHGSPNGC